VPLTIAVETTILSLTLTSETGENIKLDSMAGVHIRTLSTASHYSYEIDYSLYRDGTLIADSVERGAADQTGMTDINLSPDLTWVDAPTGGSHTYEIKVLYAGTGLDTVDVRLSQSLNAPICDD
jgi:hypothetical protein